jgi:RNA polymerase sigma-70 factor (ECF subfamily)
VVIWQQKTSPQYIAEQDEEAQYIQRAVAALPLAQRVVVVLYYVNDLPLQEIAEILNIPEGTVKSRLHYGRQALKRGLGLSNDTPLEIQYEFT